MPALRQLTPIVCPLTVSGILGYQTLLHELGNDRRNSARAIVILPQIFAGGLQVHQQGYLVAI